MSYGHELLSSPVTHTKYLPIFAGEGSGAFLVLPNIYAEHKIVYVREGSVYADLKKAIYKVNFRLKDGKS